MEFAEFTDLVSKIKNLPLPGESFHYIMAPSFRLKEIKKRLIERKSPKQAGVMALFYPNPDSLTNLLLILRNTYPGIHSNQIGFPGGKSEKADLDFQQTALREMHEEVGIPPQKVHVIRSLTSLYIPPSNFEVFHFMGMLSSPQKFIPDTSEVEALVEVSLAELMDPERKITQSVNTSYAKDVQVPAFHLGGHVVWGATAMMLNEILELFRRGQ